MPRMSQSAKAGIVFPVARCHRKLKTMPQKCERVSKGAGVYMAAVLEYLTAEALELAGNAARDNRQKRITPRHLLIAIKNDAEIEKLLKDVILPSGGVMPTIHPEVLPNGNCVPFRKPALTKRLNINLNKKGAAAANFSTVFASKPKLVKIPSNLKDSKGKNVTILSEKILTSGQKITVVQADIVDVVVDAIVHPTSNSIYLGGQVGSAIARKGGAAVNNAIQQLRNRGGNLAVGGVDISESSPTMLCNNIIHVYSPSWDTTHQAQRINDLTKAVTNILTLANTNKIKTVALPSISSGGNGFPKQVAAQTILRAINAYFKALENAGAANKTSVEQVYFVLYDLESVGVYTSELSKLE